VKLAPDVELGFSYAEYFRISKSSTTIFQLKTSNTTYFSASTRREVCMYPTFGYKPVHRIARSRFLLLTLSFASGSSTEFMKPCSQRMSANWVRLFFNSCEIHKRSSNTISLCVKNTFQYYIKVALIKCLIYSPWKFENWYHWKST
jgi:hypothetical protein